MAYPGSRFPMMAYDAARSEIVMCCGSQVLAATGAQQNDTWTRGYLTGWTAKSPARSLPIRALGAIGYDSDAQKVVVFGGNQNGVPIGDHEAWNGSTWIAVTPVASPTARHSAAMVYDPVRGRMVLFGGRAGGIIAAQTWTYNDGTNTWTNVSPGTQPAGREYHTMVWDSVRERVVLFGGSTGTRQKDTWEWDGTAWVDRTPAAIWPSARYLHSACFDPVRGKMIVFGGNDGVTLSDTWEWTGGTPTGSWASATTPAALTARSLASLAWDTAGARGVMFSGSNATTFFGDTWTLAGGVWTAGDPLGSGDATAPSVSGVTPAGGATLVPTSTVQLDVTDAGGFRRVLLVAELPTSQEVIHNGAAFTATYQESTRTAITNGWRYVVRRVGGWPRGSWTLRPYAIDTSGNENA